MPRKMTLPHSWLKKISRTTRLLDETGKSIIYYWTPVNEYDNLIKIGFHGSSGGCINPDARDDPSVQNPQKYAELLQHQKETISRIFPGLETKNGPAINETCIYTVHCKIFKCYDFGSFFMIF